jgi:hypothetical protein
VPQAPGPHRIRACDLGDPAPAWRARTVCISLAAALCAACATPPPPVPAAELAAINARLDRLEAQLDSIERLLTNVPSPPLRSRAEIVANIERLERRRAELLERYTPLHPNVREVDLSLKLLRLQLDVIDQASRVPQ